MGADVQVPQRVTSATGLAGRIVQALPPGAVWRARDIAVRRRYAMLRPEDLLLASFPRSGSTWLRMVLTDMWSDQEVGFDHLADLAPSLGDRTSAPGLLPSGGRLVKSHEPYRRLIPRRPGRSLYLVRDGRDVAVSSYHHRVRKGTYAGEFSPFLRELLDGRIVGRAGTYGPWHEHALGWTRQAEAGDGSVAVIRYEDMLDDAAVALGTALERLDIPCDADRLVQSVAANGFTAMKDKEARSARMQAAGQGRGDFVRSGVAGGWHDTFSDEDEQLFLSVAGPALRALGYV